MFEPPSSLVLGHSLDYRGSGGYGHARPIHGHIPVVCKRNGDSPYIVANELVAAEIGRVLRLPVPPGFVVRDAAETPHFASLNFNPGGVPLPPIVPAFFINAFRPQLASIVVFDMLIANTDRHVRNISADYGKLPGHLNLLLRIPSPPLPSRLRSCST